VSVFNCGSAHWRDLRSLWVALTFIAIGITTACDGYLPGRQADWDEKVKAMCEKDGGVRIFEQVRVSDADLSALGKTDGMISIPIKEAAHPNAPVYSVLQRTRLAGEGNVSIGRVESSITRRSDGVVVARWVAYSRSGGEPPVGLSDGTTFFCPDLKKITMDL
jgi:hypothetical protein